MVRRVKRFLILPLLAFTGCSCDETIGGISAQIELMPESIDFGQVAVNSTKDVTLKITNKGTFQLRIEGYEADAPFLAPEGPTIVPTGRSSTVTVGFLPTALGAQQGTLTLTTNDPDAPTIDVPLSGTGIEAAVTVDPTSIDFGEVLWTRTAQPERRTITVTNPGSDSFDLTSLTLVDTASNAFALEGAMAAIKTYAPRASATFEVTYRPNRRGAVNGKIRLTTTTRAAPVIEVPLEAKGVGPEINLCTGVLGGSETCTQRGDRPRIDFLVDRMAMGQGRVRVINTGDRDLTVSQVLLPGAAAEFSVNPSIMNMAPVVIPAGMERPWDVTYTPADYLFDSVILSFVSDATNTGANSLRMEGRVRRQAIRVIPLGVTLRIEGGVTRSQLPIKIYSCGDFPLTIRSIRVRQTSGPGSVFSLARAPMDGAVLQPTADCENNPAAAEFDIIFETMTFGNYSAEIDIMSDDPIDSLRTVTVGATKS